MVASKLKQPQELESPFEQKDSRLLPTPFTYGAVLVSRIISNECRLDASSYNMDVMNALNIVYKNSFGYIYLSGKDGLINTAYYPGRYKRIYTDVGNGIPFYLPSQLDEIYPKPTKYISQKTAFLLKDDYIKDKNLLLSRSGTIGKCAISSKTTIGKLFSDDVIRITFKKDYDLGYTYAFLNTEVGLTILQSNNYGAVIDHIEPEHLSNIPIPNASVKLREKIHDLVVSSFEMRDLSNKLIDQAESMLFVELNIPQRLDSNSMQYDLDAGFCNFSLKASDLEGRLDVSYHLPEVENLLKEMYRNAANVITLGDHRISKSICVGSRFKRIYVSKNNGIVYLNGKSINQLNPNGCQKKYLSFSQHEQRIKEELIIKPNTILVTCSGTIGKVVLVPKHWDGWAGTHDLIRIIPCDNSIAGYLFCYLNSNIGKILLLRNAYGAVVDHIEPYHLQKTVIPILKNKKIQDKINDLVLEANDLRYQAHQKEQEAISMMNDILINRKN